MNERRKAICADYVRGASQAELALKYGLTPGAVSQAVIAGVAVGLVPAGLTKERKRLSAKARRRRPLSATAAENVRRAARARSCLSWPPATVQKLQYLISRGYSAALIGDEIGKSRNAVIGFCFRNGFQLAPDPEVSRIRNLIGVRESWAVGARKPWGSNRAEAGAAK